jgi:hypothetical protein
MKIHIWLDGEKYEGTWKELYSKLQQKVEICCNCEIECVNLERFVEEVENDFGKHLVYKYRCPDGCKAIMMDVDTRDIDEDDIPF